MIFWRLLFVFLRIGIFSFGGGLAMISLIRHEVVDEQGWLTTQEFTDIVATSQVTPGPVGINTATYTGYIAVVNSGYPHWVGVVGALLSSFAVILLPLLLMLFVSRLLLKHKDNPTVANLLSLLRLACVGLVAAAALSLMTIETFGSFSSDARQFCISIGIFAAVFIASFKFKVSPILLILICGALGALLYL